MAGIITPDFQSATRRRELRMKVRNALGVSSDRAPGPSDAMRAAYAMDDLLRRATNQRYSLRVFRGGQEVGWGEAVADCIDNGRNE